MATAKDNTAAQDAPEQKLTVRRYADGDHKWESFSEQIFLADHSHKCPTYVHRTPPCQGSCPSGEDIRGWLSIVAQTSNKLMVVAITMYSSPTIYVVILGASIV